MKLEYLWKDNNFVINTEAVEQFNKWFDEDVKKNRYSTDEEILKQCVEQYIKIKPNPSRNDIYTIVTMINSFYSTRMGADDCWALSKILHDKHVEIRKAITEQDIDCVRRIIEEQDKLKQNKEIENTANNRQEDIKRVAFSFTTKYFSILSRFVAQTDLYPIYDSVVANVLDYYFYRREEEERNKEHRKGRNNKHRVSECNSANSKDYKTYVKIIDGLNIKPYKHLDNYLWTIGRLLSDGIRKAIQPNDEELEEEKKKEHKGETTTDNENEVAKKQNNTDSIENKKSKKRGNKKLNIPSWFVLKESLKELDENFIGTMMNKIFEDNNRFNVEISKSDYKE